MAREASVNSIGDIGTEENIISSMPETIKPPLRCRRMFFFQKKERTAPAVSIIPPAKKEAPDMKKYIRELSIT
jgi:hypothetical protein